MVEIESSNLEKFGRGALSGASVGLCIGFIYGNGSITGTIAKSMGASAVSFGFFMGSEGRRLPTNNLLNNNNYNNNFNKFNRNSYLFKEKRY
ncbi:hypothetical protein PIROE2DRAFT_7854 [Piromyces sp. E2]|nr:hypothetical protein PIROE2DRAFT_7854 [Piromyces sp. E2]|eukprot:OUM65220.1 hypothetical protein PIROE2DRAFT_7854 [Piromyces sp. E2]